uniref:CP12 domain-containing protein n=1 Tax=Oryza meridionalis TaxID=40149 RepID=A0A0E0C0Y7_9ORYZ
MASTLTNVGLSTPAAAASSLQARPVAGAANRVVFPRVLRRGGFAAVRASGPATPPDISDKMSESIDKAKEACAEDKASGECAAAWDEVEELSAAASHARDKLKETSDPLEAYCKDNPETDECRTYDN